jgi:hypothetical protein
VPHISKQLQVLLKQGPVLVMLEHLWQQLAQPMMLEPWQTSPHAHLG